MTGAHFAADDAVVEGGRLRLVGPGAALCRWLDDRFLRMAVDAGATECRFPATIARETLARAGYLDAFPRGATTVSGDGSGGDYMLCPAACYHAYAWLGGTRLDRPMTLTTVQTCFRESDRAAASRSRLWEFTMREVIFVGPAEWVAARCDEWMPRIAAVAADLDLGGAVEPATDPFFGDAGRGRRLLQQVKELKRELRVDCDGAALAIASVNRHETFFSKRFAFELAGSGETHSGCAAFGIERWALALLERRGADGAAALMAR